MTSAWVALQRRLRSGRARSGASALRLAVLVAVVLQLAAGGVVRAAGRPAAHVHAPARVSASHPACFGAAARDPRHPCRNAALTLAVWPTPGEALIMPNTPCAPWVATPEICTFGVPADKATRTIALVGDSHAWQWRGAVGVLAQSLHWHALSITRYTCPFTEGITTLPEPERVQCTDWHRNVLAWFGQHPEVSTVFISNHPGRVKRSRGQGLLAAQIAGIAAAWNGLPPTVQHIIVIRDTPYMREDTLACVERARLQHRDAGRACAVRRFGALRYDPDVRAARWLRSRRVQIVDLTHFLCSHRLCYPVVGGALAYRDAGHISSVFATTLGAFLRRQVVRLMYFWY
jgi:SGNH domain (fused to AT3 domains)